MARDELAGKVIKYILLALVALCFLWWICRGLIHLYEKYFGKKTEGPERRRVYRDGPEPIWESDTSDDEDDPTIARTPAAQAPPYEQPPSYEPPPPPYPHHAPPPYESVPAHELPFSEDEQPPAYEAPADGAPVYETPADEAPAGETPAGEAPVNEAPAVEEQKDQEPLLHSAEIETRLRETVIMMPD